MHNNDVLKLCKLAILNKDEKKLFIYFYKERRTDIIQKKEAEICTIIGDIAHT